MHGMNPLALSPAEFRRLAAEIAELSAEYLAQLPTRAIFPATSGVDCERLFALDLPENGLGPSALTALREVMNHSRAQNGRFFGYVQGPGEPIAALGDLFTSVINQNMTAWRSSPSAVTIERTVVRWLAQAVGCPGFTGTLTGGGPQRISWASPWPVKRKLQETSVACGTPSPESSTRPPRSTWLSLKLPPCSASAARTSATFPATTLTA